ncbi:hypothetical protein AB0M44_41660 [Streptosporangium subroseum]|uniref:hypothetical protein n=1 Tax=Streptosporangium subroseum TaxID=106412 RepID=UPI00341AAE6E
MGEGVGAAADGGFVSDKDASDEVADWVKGLGTRPQPARLVTRMVASSAFRTLPDSFALSQRTTLITVNNGQADRVGRPDWPVSPYFMIKDHMAA